MALRSAIRGEFHEPLTRVQASRRRVDARDNETRQMSRADAGAAPHPAVWRSMSHAVRRGRISMLTGLKEDVAERASFSSSKDEHGSQQSPALPLIGTRSSLRLAEKARSYRRRISLSGVICNRKSCDSASAGRYCG